MQVAELIDIICSDEDVAEDGFSNLNRSIFICDTLNVEGITLNDTFDYSVALRSQDKEFIQAAYHLSRMQAQYHFAMSQNELASDAERFEAEGWFHQMHLESHRIAHHFEYASVGKPTPKDTHIN